MAQNYSLQLNSYNKTHSNRKKSQKKGMVGPYRCFPCELEEETISYVLEVFPFASTMWDQGAFIFRIYDSVRKNMDQTLIEWTNNPFHNPILNRLW